MKGTQTRVFPIFAVWLALMAIPVKGCCQSTDKITVEDIYRYSRFSPLELEGLNSMRDGEHYTVQNGTRIGKYSYRTGEKIETLFDVSRFSQVDRFSAYQFDQSEEKILIETAREKIYRHSSRADFWVYDRRSGSLEPVSKGGKQQLGTFSPSGELVAFVRDNNIYISDLSSKDEKQITFDGTRNQVINGIPDWVYEEEFAFSKGFCWSPDGRKIAFYRFDESRVRQFHMTMFGPLYPEAFEFKYPKAGEDNAVVTIHVYDLESGVTTTMDTGPDTDQYIPRIRWTTDPEILSILRLNRLQNQLDVLHADASTGTTTLVYREVNPRYITEPTDKTVSYLSDGKHLILHSERNGFYHLYLLNFHTGEMDPITTGSFDVSEFMGYDEKNNRLYYISCEESSTERHLYSIRLNGKGKKKISSRKGTHTATFSTTFDYYILNNSSLNTPNYTTLHDHRGKQIRVLLDNSGLTEKMKQYGFSNFEYLTVPTKSGLQLNAWMLKPANFDPAKTYPLFVYVYGGPESHRTLDEWVSRVPWFQMLAQHGYIVACVDNRGTDGRGEEFRKATYLNLGRLETIDQLEAAEWFGRQEYIDADRMGIFGWSYGGFMSSLCMTKGHGTFRMGIAVAPVTNWRYYDTIYTERFMRTPQENPEGYDQNSPINFAKRLQGKFLLIHGSGDDNVHFQNSMDLAEALVRAGKQFEMQFYPNKDHSIDGGNTSFHVYQRMTDFILENL